MQAVSQTGVVVNVSSVSLHMYRCTEIKQTFLAMCLEASIFMRQICCSQSNLTNSVHDCYFLLADLQNAYNYHMPHPFHTGGLVAEWLECWTQAQKGLG